ncbi:DUF6318 family protein [Glutamicibacter arilaitensis]|uniref:DUF6318 family protein n=1 Tax=Glutamicibacter arilaitensis TaxID=256701 RepID=UPI003A8CA12B
MEKRKITIIMLFTTTAIALSGCNLVNADTPTNSHSAKPSTASESPTVDAKKYKAASADGPAENVIVPKIPAVAKEKSQEGASAFAKYYFDLVNYTIETNDVEPLTEVTSKDCIVCGVSIIDEATEAKRLGKWQVGGMHHAKILDSNLTGKNQAAVIVAYTADKAQIYLAENDMSSELDVLELTTVSVEMKYNHGWKVHEIVSTE